MNYRMSEMQAALGVTQLEKLPEILNRRAANFKALKGRLEALQAVSVLVQAAKSVLAVPLAIRIHEGLVWSNRDQRTLLDKMLALLKIVDIQQPFYFVAGAYYASQKIITGLLEQDNHLITRVRSNAVAYTRHEHQGVKKRGRPRLYGKKIKLKGYGIFYRFITK